MRPDRLLLALLATAAPLVLGLAGPAAAQADKPQVVAIELSEFKFTPKALILKPHTPYVLQITDTGAGGHDLAAPEFFKASNVQPATGPGVEDGKVEVRKGDTVTVALTTGDAGSYTMHCTHPGHSMFGMKGTIEVR